MVTSATIRTDHLPQSSFAPSRETRAIWLLVAAVAVVDAALCAAGGFRVVWAGLLPPLASASALVGAAAYLRARERNPAAIALLDGTAQIIAGFAACGILSYLALSTNRPFVDAQLAAADRALGFDWPEFVGWVQATPLVDTVLHTAYHATLFVLVATIVTIGAVRRERVPELAAVAIIALVATIAVAAVAPAADAYLYYKPAHPALVDEIPVSDHLALRAGTLREIDLRRLEGLVTFPSYHVILSLLFVYVVRGIRFVFPVSAVFNATVVVSTLSAGGHYLVDAPGGLAVTLLSIVLWRRASRMPDAAPLSQAMKGISMRKHLVAALADKSGATAVEYGLMMALIMVAVLVGITSVGTQLGTLFDNIATTVINSPAG